MNHIQQEIILLESWEFNVYHLKFQIEVWKCNSNEWQGVGNKKTSQQNPKSSKVKELGGSGECKERLKSSKGSEEYVFVSIMSFILDCPLIQRSSILLSVGPVQLQIEIF